MALRKIRTEEDEILRKISRPVEAITEKILVLIDDMIETMNHANGVGLAAPQVGVLKRIIIVDVGDGPIPMINPVIIETEGIQEGMEGCLSVPGKSGTVVRPNFVKVEYLDEEGEVAVIEGDELFARAICHEVDHLDGKLYIDIATDLVEEE